jgi:hypothetical protein
VDVNVLLDACPAYGGPLAAEAEALQAEITYQLRDRHLQNPDNQRLLNELGWPYDRGNPLRFLANPRIEPTNHRAERALRPAVIARKVSQCSQSGRGAQAFAAFTGVVRNAGTTWRRFFSRRPLPHVPVSEPPRCSVLTLSSPSDPRINSVQSIPQATRGRKARVQKRATSRGRACQYWPS